jgi:hypothetical protein
VVAAAATEKRPAAGGEEDEKTFVEEMKAIAMRLHTEDQARIVNLRNATVEGYLRFLVDSKLVFETLENIVDRAAVPWCESVQTLAIGLPCPAFFTCYSVVSWKLIPRGCTSAGIFGSGRMATCHRTLQNIAAVISAYPI